MIADLGKLDPFTHMDSRSHNSFPDIKRSSVLKLNILDFHKWLDKHKNRSAKRTCWYLMVFASTLLNNVRAMLSTADSRTDCVCESRRVAELFRHYYEAHYTILYDTILTKCM